MHGAVASAVACAAQQAASAAAMTHLGAAGAADAARAQKRAARFRSTVSAKTVRKVALSRRSSSVAAGRASSEGAPKNRREPDGDRVCWGGVAAAAAAAACAAAAIGARDATAEST
jgi:hypothetical protein